jgi:hypothetical protein
MTRPLDSKNKAPSKLMMAREACLSVNLDPFVELARMAQLSDDENLRLRALKELAGFLQPKLQSIQHSGGTGEPLVINLNMGAGPDEPSETVDVASQDELPKPFKG